jgi:H+-translocating NAD(P) transhydrogenase subunit alpha
MIDSTAAAAATATASASATGDARRAGVDFPPPGHRARRVVPRAVSQALSAALCVLLGLGALATMTHAVLGQPEGEFNPEDLRPPDVVIEDVPNLATDQQAFVPTVARDAMGFDQFVILLTVFVLAVFVGFEIITKIPPTLHTPLMSGSNAISGITLVGALLVGQEWAESAPDALARMFIVGIAFLAVVFATINVVGGFLVTHRMLGMFRRKS